MTTENSPPETHPTWTVGPDSLIPGTGTKVILFRLRFPLSPRFALVTSLSLELLFWDVLGVGRFPFLTPWTLVLASFSFLSSSPEFLFHQPSPLLLHQFPLPLLLPKPPLLPFAMQILRLKGPCWWLTNALFVWHKILWGCTVIRVKILGKYMKTFLYILDLLPKIEEGVSYRCPETPTNMLHLTCGARMSRKSKIIQDNILYIIIK
jgi:hypothetical protein